MKLKDEFSSSVVEKLCKRFRIPYEYSEVIFWNHYKKIGDKYVLDLDDPDVKREIKKAPKVEYYETTDDRVYKICKIFYEETKRLKWVSPTICSLEYSGETIGEDPPYRLIETKEEYGIKYGVYRVKYETSSHYDYIIAFENGVSFLTFRLLDMIRFDLYNDSEAYDDYDNFYQIFDHLVNLFYKEYDPDEEIYLYPTWFRDM